jgi:SAM-dependent methyltransferase
VTSSFEDLVTEAATVDVSGWDFSWLDGRATEERPSWGYRRLLAERLGRASASLDIQTGGGEVLASALEAAPTRPQAAAATESWPPNVALATARLQPLCAVVVADPDEPPLPFADSAFDLVSSRHPASVWWTEIVRVLAPGGTYVGQHIAARTNAEVYEFFLGPQDDHGVAGRHPEHETAQAAAAGLEVLDVRTERLRVEFFDIGAVVYFLRKVIWTVPDFTVERYLDRLHDLHEQIVRDGVFVSHSTRTLIEARKPD